MRDQSVAKGFAILSLAGIFVKILSLLYIPFLLAIIGEEGNGIYAAAYQVYVLAYVLANSGIPVGISKHVAELVALKNYRDAVRSFKISRFILLLLGAFISILMFALAKPIAKAIHFEKSYLSILALSPTLLFTSVASAYRGYFQGRGNMTPTAVSQVIEQIVHIAFSLIFAALFLQYGLEAACAGGTLGTALGALASAIFLILYYRKNRKFIVPKGYKQENIQRYTFKQLASRILRYSFPITLSIGMQYAGNLVDVANIKVRLLAAGFSDARATEMYNYLYKYQQLLNAPIAVVAALGSTILPAISAAVALKDRQLVKRRVDFAFRSCFIITIPSAMGLAVLSEPIFQLLKYGYGSYLMTYGSICLVLLAVVQVQTSILQGSGKFYTVILHLFLGIIGKIVTNYYFVAIPQINIKGAILGSVVSYCIPILLNTIALKKSLKISLDYPSYITKPAVASAVMGTTIFFLHIYLSSLFRLSARSYFANVTATVITIAIGAGIYFAVMIIVGGITQEDLNFLPKSFKRFIPRQILDRISPQ